MFAARKGANRPWPAATRYGYPSTPDPHLGTV